MEEVKQESGYASLSRTVQIMTIKRINTNSLDWHYRKAKELSAGSPRPTLQELTNFAIEMYNANSAPKVIRAEQDHNVGTWSRNEDSEDNNVANSVFEPITLSEDWVKQAMANGFTLLGFYSVITIKRTIDSLLEEAGANIPKPREISHIFVFFRDSNDSRCMYTLTTGTRGYVPFQRFSDYHFPRKIAVRLLNPDKITVAESKQVIGPIIWSRVACRETPVYDPSDAFKVFTSFKAPLRPKSSMFSVFDFPYKAKKDGNSEEFTEFEIRQGGIRIEKCMRFTVYPHILNHFEVISNGGKTCQHLCGVEETDSEADFRHLFYLTYVEDNMTVNKLQNCLLHQLVKCFSAPDNHDTWDVCHPKLEDYYKSSTFCLKYNHGGTSYSCEFPNRLSFHELREEVANLRTQVHCYTSALATVLLNIQLGFRLGGNWVLAPILDCLMGQLDVVDHNGEVKTYYKLSKPWYEVDQHLLKTVDREFQHCMKACMLFDNQEGFLPHPWISLKPTLKEISKQLKISPDDTRVLCKSTFSYVNESDGNKVMCSVLAGEILRNPNVQKHTRDIEELLTKSTLKREDLNVILKQGDKSCGDYIWKELVKKRTVGKVHGKTERVLITNPYFPNGMPEQREKLAELANRSLWTKSEGEYNEGYLFTQRKETEGEQPEPYRLEEGTGYLLGDRICPQGIELFDILYFTPEKTYLYHVKDGFDQNTRVACSQIRNSAIQLMNALQHQSSILDQFYKIAVHEESKSDSNSNPNNKKNSKPKTEPKLSEYRRLVKQQMEAFDKDNFMKLFKRGKENIVFVFAFFDSRSSGYCELTLDMINKENFSPGDFATEDPVNTGQFLFKELVNKGYLDEDGKQDKKFFDISKADQLLLENKATKNTVWKILNGGLASFASFIARLEVLHTRAAIQKMGFDFKICQIKQPGEFACLTGSRPGIFTVSSDVEEPTSLVYHRNEDGTATMIGFRVPQHEPMKKSYSAFRALFGESCRSESDERTKFVDLMRFHLDEKDKFVLKFLKDNTKFLVLEAVWREDSSSELSMDIKNKKRFLTETDGNNSKTVERLYKIVSQIKNLLSGLLEEIVRNNSLNSYMKTELAIDEKTKVDIKDWLRRHCAWFIKIVCALKKNHQVFFSMTRQLQSDFRRFSRLLNDLDEYVNEFCEEQSFRPRTLAYFQREQPFTSYELELLAYVNKMPVEIIRERICSDEYECINSQVFHQTKEMDRVIVREKDMVYERCELGDTPGAFQSIEVTELE